MLQHLEGDASTYRTQEMMSAATAHYSDSVTRARLDAQREISLLLRHSKTTALFPATTSSSAKTRERNEIGKEEKTENTRTSQPDALATSDFDMDSDDSCSKDITSDDHMASDYVHVSGLGSGHVAKKHRRFQQKRFLRQSKQQKSK